MKKIIIGIDPGLTGGIAILDSGTMELITVVDMPIVPEGGKKKVIPISFSKYVTNSAIAFIL
ncbi:hypothetical protein [Endozoicomonas atrinae]|uniref:hypothetical protein n=1 Tax=Endozoicomonas atrinae TaxID=1333660 RepID=UPI00082578E6|nr:hypothetical protein [Endozoicomonas atrinae]